MSDLTAEQKEIVKQMNEAVDGLDALALPIIEAAEKAGADLIVIGSHGRRGIEGLLLGSQAIKLLTHTKIPALVVR